MSSPQSFDELVSARTKMRAESDRLYEKMDDAETNSDTAVANQTHKLIVALELRLESTQRDIDKLAGHAVPEEMPDAVLVEVQAATVAVTPKELEMTESTKAFEDAIADDTASFVGAVETKFVPAFASKAIQADEVAGVIAIDGFKTAFPKTLVGGPNALEPNGSVTDILILRGPKSVGSPEHRVHLTTFEDVRRAARGLALNFAGAIAADGSVSNGRGERYVVQGGICTRHTSQKQVNYDGTTTLVELTSDCLGGGENVQRCKHAWALMFNAGTFVTVSRQTFFKIVLVEFQRIIGTKEDVENANAQIATWRENRATRAAPRNAIGAAIGDAANRGLLGADGLIPPVPTVLDEVIAGKTVRQSLIDSNGKMFRVKVTLPVKREDGTCFDTFPVTRVLKNAQDLASAVAPIYHAAELAGKQAAIAELLFL